MPTNYGSGSALNFNQINVYACVLAGGQSRRMGRDKSSLVHKNKSLLEYCLQCLGHFKFKKLFVSKGANASLSEGVIDLFPNAGPVGGIYSICESAEMVSGDYIVFLPVDMPNIEPSIIDHLLKQAFYHNSSCFYQDAFFPIVLRFNKQKHALLYERLSQQKIVSIKGLLADYNAKALPVPANTILNNLNTPNDWRKFIAQ